MRDTGDFPVWNGADFLHITQRGELRVWLAAPTVLVMKYRGYCDGSFIDFIEDVWNQTLEATPGAIQIFADTELQTGFAHGFRTGMARWNQRIVARTDTYCLLVKSRWIAMGIALVRATIGVPSRHAEVTTKRDVFHARLESAVRRTRPRYEVIRGAANISAGNGAPGSTSAASISAASIPAASIPAASISAASISAASISAASASNDSAGDNPASPVASGRSFASSDDGSGGR